MSPRHTFAPTPLDELLRDLDREYLRPRAEVVAEAKERADRLIEELDLGRAPMFQVLDVHEHGSLSRGTALRGFRDLDRLVELDPTALRTRSGHTRSPRDTIARMARYIEQRRAGLVALGHLKVRRQDHSVGVVYPQSDLRIDLVPGVFVDDMFWIPEKGTNRWITTDPEETARRLRVAKDVAQHTGIAVRLLKGWARARGPNAPIPSFAIETLVVDRVLKRPTSLPGLIFWFFRTIASAHAGRRLVLGNSTPTGSYVSLTDPVSGNNLTKELGPDHRKRLVRTCRTSLKAMQDIEAGLEGPRPREAARSARALFVGRRWAALASPG